MKRAFVTRAIAGLALLAVALGAVAFQAKEADAQVPFVTTGGPYAGTAGVPMRLSAASNVGPVSSVVWSFGDGSSDRGFTVLKTYVVPGVYPVSVTVTNIFGQSFTASTTAAIGGAAIPAIGPNCQYVITPAGTLSIDPWTLRLTTHSQVTPVGSVVCNATPAVIPGTVVVSPSCYTVLVQYGYFPAWAVACR